MAIGSSQAPPLDALPRVLTRSQVAKALQLSIKRVREFESDGRLHPTKDPRTQVHYFERAEILQLARVRGQRMRSELIGGPKAAKAFEAFEARMSLAQIVIRLELVPEVVRELYDQWRSFAGSEPMDFPVAITPERRAELERASDDRAADDDAKRKERLEERRSRARKALHPEGGK